MTEPKVSILQDGARRHYAVPIALQRAGILERCFTDWYTSRGSIESVVTKTLKLFNPGRAQRMQERFAAELDATKVYSKPVLIFSQFFGRRHFKSDVEYYAWMSDLVGRWVLDKGFGESNCLYGFVRNIFPGLCSTAKFHGLKIITDQIIAPFPIEHAESIKQRERFPNWSTFKPQPNERTLIDFERGTWEQSDLITCMSEYVRDGLIQQGVDAKKVVITRYPFEGSQIKASDRRGRTGPVTVGFVGQVSLRKGAPYFFQVARRFDPQTVRFVMVGPLAIETSIAEAHRGQVELLGPAARSQIEGWLEKFDILLFPSTCEGSAGAVTEAMMAGLPVVASPNSGATVRHGVDGFLCPYDDIDRMADYIQRLVNDGELRHHMGQSGRAYAASFDLNYYGERMKELFQGLLNSQKA